MASFPDGRRSAPRLSSGCAGRGDGALPSRAEPSRSGWVSQPQSERQGGEAAGWLRLFPFEAAGGGSRWAGRGVLARQGARGQTPALDPLPRFFRADPSGASLRAGREGGASRTRVAFLKNPGFSRPVSAPERWSDARSERYMAGLLRGGRSGLTCSVERSSSSCCVRTMFKMCEF